MLVIESEATLAVIRCSSFVKNKETIEATWPLLVSMFFAFNEQRTTNNEQRTTNNEQRITNNVSSWQLAVFPEKKL